MQKYDFVLDKGIFVMASLVQHVFNYFVSGFSYLGH